MQKVTKVGLLAGVLLGALVLGRASGTSDAISIYVSGQLVGKAIVVGDQTYVPLRLVSQAFSADVDYDSANRRIEITRWGQTRQPVRPGYPLAQTQDTWRAVENGNGSVRFRDAAVTGYRFQAEVNISSGFLEATSKPVSADFLVTLYDADGQIVGRGTQRVYSISSGGGSYLIDGPVVPVASSVYSCSIKFVSAWVPRN
jgi:hypothetical protein